MTTEIDYAALREAGAISVQALLATTAAVQPGITTIELDRIAEEVIRGAGAAPAFLGFSGFTGTICASVNNQVVHTPPGDYALKNGDIITIDLGAKVRGWNTDTAITLAVGKISHEVANLMAVTEQSLKIGMEELVLGKTVGDWGAAVQQYVEAAGLSIIRQCTGHGVGRELHGDPSIPNYGKPGRGPAWEEGLVIAVEPIVALGKPDLVLEPDKWTLATEDGSPAAHFEETVIITAGRPERITPLDEVLRAARTPDRLGKVT